MGRADDGRQVLEQRQRDVRAGQLLRERRQRVRQLRGAIVDSLGLLALRARKRGLRATKQGSQLGLASRVCPWEAGAWLYPDHQEHIHADQARGVAIGVGASF